MSPVHCVPVSLTDRFPQLGGALPRRGNLVSRTIGRLVIRMWGWRFTGELPDVSKAVVIVAPHTSNWDFVLGVAGMFAVGVRFSWLGKHTLFKGPAGGTMRWLGGIAVDRRSSSGVVEQIVALFHTSGNLILGMSPEGTRSHVDRWKTGFYHIAAGAGVPIVPISFDYGTRTIRFGEPLAPSGDLESDLPVLKRFYSGVAGRRPQPAVA